IAPSWANPTSPRRQGDYPKLPAFMRLKRCPRGDSVNRLPTRSRSVSRDANKARAAASKTRTLTSSTMVLHKVLYNIGETVLEEPCIPPALPFSSALPQARVMNRIPATAKALCAGFVVTILQIVVAIFFLVPEGPLESRYRTLLNPAHHWFTYIA